MSEPIHPTTDQHTPGPWRAVRVPINPWWKVYIEGREVAEVEGGDVVVYNDPNHPQAVEANARLIAAAPELLEALKLLAEETKLSGNWNAKDYGWPKAITATIAALAKAEGSHV